jgi:hypothetical protein
MIEPLLSPLPSYGPLFQGEMQFGFGRNFPFTAPPLLPIIESAVNESTHTARPVPAAGTLVRLAVIGSTLTQTHTVCPLTFLPEIQSNH